MNMESYKVQNEKHKDDLLKSTLSEIVASTSKIKKKKLAETIEDNFLMCKLCHGTFKNPKCLSCLHSFCEQCLEQHLFEKEKSHVSFYKQHSDYRDISCPTCARKTALPLGGVRRLPDNFIVNGLTDVIIKQKPTTENQCDVCIASKKNLLSHAVLRCLECNKHLCNDCASIHKSTNVTKHHSLFDLKLQREIQCSEHQDEVVRFYCETCESCVCVVCTFQEHQNHDVLSFEEATAKFEQPIRQLAKQCENKLLLSEESLEKLERSENLIKCVEQCVKDKAAEMMSDLKIREKQVLEEIKKLYGKELLDRINHKKDFLMQIENMKNTNKLTEMVLKEKSVEFLLLKKTIESRLSLIESLDQKFINLPSTIEKLIEFRPNAFSFGYIYDYDHPDVPEDSTQKVVFENPKQIPDRFITKESHNNFIYKNKNKESLEKVHKNGDHLKKKNVEVQTDPLSLDFLINAYKQERKYSPGKDVFYSTPSFNVRNNFSFEKKSSSVAPIGSQSLSSTKKKNLLFLPEIPSFEELSNLKIKNNLDKPVLNDGSYVSDQKKKKFPKELSCFDTTNSKTHNSNLEKICEKLEENPKSNGFLEQEKTCTELVKIPKVVATVAPNICSPNKPVQQSGSHFTQAGKKTTSILQKSNEFEKDQKDLKSNEKNESSTKQLDKRSEISNLSTASKASIDKKPMSLTHLSDSPLFKKPVSSHFGNSKNELFKDRKSQSKFSTNPALQLFYQTIGSEKPAYQTSKFPSNTFSSPKSSRNSDGFKYNFLKFS